VGLSQLERSAIERARNTGNSALAVPLTDEICKYLVAVIVRDRGHGDRFPGLPSDVPEFFSAAALLQSPEVPGDFFSLLSELAEIERDTVTYFSCLAALHKGRLKYHRILQCQPLPTVEQVGPRGLVQYGTLPTPALAALLFWRKWLYDLDNRAAQETGYLFEPLIAAAVGGEPFSAKKSPVKRAADRTKGRQVDCIKGRRAYEIKMRVTIAASGQGRWAEEMEFPDDARASGYTPVLLVFDGTPNEKLTSLRRAFEVNGGEAHIGTEAWEHLDAVAGPTMATFIERYVREPIQAILTEASDDGQLPEITLTLTKEALAVAVGGQTWEVRREVRAECSGEVEE